MRLVARGCMYCEGKCTKECISEEYNQDKMEKPTQLIQVNLDELRKICQEYVDFVDSDDEYYEDNNFDQYIFEKAMMVLYGKDVFNWINERRD